MIVAFLTAHLIEIAAVAEAIVAVLGVGVQLVGGEPDRLSAFDLLREVLVVVAVRGEPVVLAASVVYKYANCKIGLHRNAAAGSP